MKKCFWQNQYGQTMVEYSLLILVVAIVASSVFGQFKAYLVDNPDSYLNTYLDSFGRYLGSSGGINGNYKLFRIP